MLALVHSHLFLSSWPCSQTFRRREFALVAVETQKFLRFQHNRGRDVQNVQGAMATGLGVRGGEAFGDAQHVRRIDRRDFQRAAGKIGLQIGESMFDLFGGNAFLGFCAFSQA